jgi:acyl-CoA dehydrogenase
MDFTFDARTEELRKKLLEFMTERIRPAEAVAAEQRQHAEDPWRPVPVLDELRAEARERGLWNLFLPDDRHGAGLTNLQYAPLAEITGRSPQLAPSALNCAAPDTGNMEVLAQFGSAEQQRRWLTPLLNAEIRSAFAMTEPDVASSDATNIGTRIERQGDEYVINGRKWYISGAMNPDCAIFIVMGKTDPDSADVRRQQSMVLVPRDTPGLEVRRGMRVFGYSDDWHGGHAEVDFTDVRVPVDHLIGEEGGGFAIAQARLGPGRIHHCMRLIGMAERAIELMCRRALDRTAFGRPLAAQGVVREWIADARVAVEQLRLLVLKTAWLMDTVGNRGAHTEIQAIKIAVPRTVVSILDRAIQLHGAAGVSQDTPLAELWASARTLQLADGPDEVHQRSLARRELRRYAVRVGKRCGRRLRDDHHAAGGDPVGHPVHGLGRVLQRHAFADQGADGALGDQLGQLPVAFVDGLRVAVVVQAPVQPEDAVVLHQRVVQPGGGHGAAGEADDQDAALEGDALDRFGVGVAAHRVVHHIGAAAAGGLLDDGHDVLAAAVDHHIAALLPGDPGLLRAAGHPDHGGARRLAQLHGGAAHAPGRGVHQQGLPRLDPGPAVQGEPAGLIADVQRGGLRVVQALRCRPDTRGRYHGLLGEGAGAFEQRRLGEHPGADLDVGSLAGRQHLTAQLHPGGERHRRPDLVLATAQQRVGEVDVGGEHPQQQLPGAGLRGGHLVEPHHLARFAVLLDLPCLHRCLRWVSECASDMCQRVGKSCGGGARAGLRAAVRAAADRRDSRPLPAGRAGRPAGTRCRGGGPSRSGSPPPGRRAPPC